MIGRVLVGLVMIESTTLVLVSTMAVDQDIPTHGISIFCATSPKRQQAAAFIQLSVSA